MDPDTTSVIRDIFVIVAAGALAALCVSLMVLVAKLYAPLRRAINSTSSTAENLSRISQDIAGVSAETSGNVLHTSRNAVTISENIKETSEGLPETIETAREAARNVSAAAETAREMADMVSRVGSLGITGGGSSSGVGTLLRIVRGLFGGGRKGDDA